MAISEDVALFQEIRTALVKVTTSERTKPLDATDSAIRQLVSQAVTSSEVVDIFAAAGLELEASVRDRAHVASIMRHLRNLPPSCASPGPERLLNNYYARHYYARLVVFSEIVRRAALQH